jgi:hypothetical protein
MVSPLVRLSALCAAVFVTLGISPSVAKDRGDRASAAPSTAQARLSTQERVLRAVVDDVIETHGSGSSWVGRLTSRPPSEEEAPSAEFAVRRVTGSTSQYDCEVIVAPIRDADRRMPGNAVADPMWIRFVVLTELARCAHSSYGRVVPFFSMTGALPDQSRGGEPSMTRNSAVHDWLLMWHDRPEGVWFRTLFAESMAAQLMLSEAAFKRGDWDRKDVPVVRDPELKFLRTVVDWKAQRIHDYARSSAINAVIESFSDHLKTYGPMNPLPLPMAISSSMTDSHLSEVRRFTSFDASVGLPSIEYVKWIWARCESGEALKDPARYFGDYWVNRGLRVTLDPITSIGRDTCSLFEKSPAGPLPSIRRELMREQAARLDDIRLFSDQPKMPAGQAEFLHGVLKANRLRAESSPPDAR